MRRSKRYPILAGLAGMIAAAPALADILVVRSSGPSSGAFRPGATLQEEREVSLKAGDILTVLDNRGTRTVRGPIQRVRLGGVRVDGDSGPSLAALIGGTRSVGARTGAVRGGMAQNATKPGNLWYLDFGKGGTQCVADPAKLTLWRGGDLSKGAMFGIAGDGKADSLTFAPGQSVAPWPATLPVTDGAHWTVAGPGLTAPVKIRLALLPEKPSELSDMARKLIEKNCTAQLDLLIETTAVPEEAPVRK